MENYGRPRRERRRRRGLLALLLAGTALISATGATMSLALFTSSATASTSFSTGTIVLGAAPSPVFTVTNMMPGDSVQQIVTVSNTGTGDLRYALTSTFAETKGLAGQLDVTIAPTASTCAAAGAAIFTGKLNAVAFGNPASGFQAGDRAVAHGTNELLCFTASLDIGTGNAFQGATASSTLTFSAEQTLNN